MNLCVGYLPKHKPSVIGIAPLQVNGSLLPKIPTTTLLKIASCISTSDTRSAEDIANKLDMDLDKTKEALAFMYTRNLIKLDSNYKVLELL